MSTNRDYNGKDVEMLQTCETIMVSAINSKPFLVSEHSAWEGDKFETILGVIQSAYMTYLGVDKLRGLREASSLVYKEQDQALIDLSNFKGEIQSCFRTNKEREEALLLTLGFTQFYRTAQTGRQETLIQFLFHFTDNMTPDIKAEILAAGTDESKINAVIDHAVVFSNLNVSQENIKGSKKVVTEAAVIALNAIYNEVMSISTLAVKYFRGQATMQELFTYAKVFRNLHSS